MAVTTSWPRKARPVGGAAAAEPSQASDEQLGAYIRFALDASCDEKRPPSCTCEGQPALDVCAGVRAAHEASSQHQPPGEGSGGGGRARGGGQGPGGGD